MGFPDRPRNGRARLAVEVLEDRTTPTKLDDALSLALPELVTTGAVLGDRVNVVMASGTNTATDAAQLAATPFAANVTPLGFGIYSVTLTPGTDLTAGLAYYSQIAGVMSAAPDEILQVQQIPNDTYYSYLYGMTKIGAPAAWDITTGSNNFVVAVIDSGVDFNHPDLAANMWVNPGEIAGDGIDNDGNGYIDDIHGWDFANNDNNPFDDNGHGTHVAGTIGAVGNNSRGVVGVNWSVKIMALKFLNASGSGSTSGAISALNHAVAQGVKVSNNSWGGGGFNSSLSSAISRARDAGHIFVAAAGNSGVNIDVSPSYPASYNYDNVVAVAATDSNDNLASFSNYGGSTVDLAAPGVSIASTTPNNGYAYMSGTSMAAPHVAGAIALYWSANPNLSYSEVITKLKSSVDVISGLNGKVSTGGRLNVANMFASSPPPFVSGPKVAAATFSGSTSTQLDKLRVTFDKSINTGTFTTADIVSFTGPNGAISTGYTITPVSGTNDTQFDISFTPQTAAGNYSFVFGPNISDTAGNLMNQDGDAINGETIDDRFTATGSLTLTTTKTYSASGLPKAIKDLQTTTSTITVADDLQLSDLNVQISLTHTYVNDLVITLTNPTGQTITLFNRRGGSGDNLNGTTFDDEASVFIGNGAAPFSGSFRPEQALSAFDGLSTKGTWTLKVSDVAKRDTGKLTAWSLTATGTAGNGGSRVRSLGTFDSLVPSLDGAPSSPAHPIAVSPAEPAGDPFASTPFVEARATAQANFLLLTDSDGAEFDARPLAVELPSARDTRVSFDAERRLDTDEPFAAAMATLYFPPDDGDRGDFGFD